MIYFTRKTKGNEDIWTSAFRDGAWTPAIPIDEPVIEGIDRVVSVNSYDNDGAHTIAPTGRFLFFTSCGRPRGFGSCDLYFSKRSGNEWGKPTILVPPINTGAWETQPCISADGKQLFFVSNREGGIGRGDIYVSTIMDNGSFSPPENLGAAINTSGNEDKPFIHPDGITLYFSSDGHPGFGQRDLFMSRKENGKWTTPINLGGQINSSGDESAIFINALGTKAYISKQNMDKPSRDYDIYSFDLPELYRPNRVTYIKGIVTNIKTNQPLKASVKVQNIEKNEPYMSISSDDKNGDFMLTLVADKVYGFDVLKEGFSFYSKNYTFAKSEDNTPQSLEIKLQPLESGTKFELRNVFFETGKFELKPESSNELNYIVEIMTKSPNIKIQILGHTDNVGQEENNQLLSENRAKAVLEYIRSKGISIERLQSKGFGASKPISPNSTEEGRAQNRRTEIEIL
jgi:outer membrane protein OmpA-like peptidoglycan-associated protein